MKAIRGATTINIDNQEQITLRTIELFEQIVMRNNIIHSNIVNIIFSCTDDISAYYPAAALRQAGYSDIPMLCLAEMNVKNSLRLCIRILIQVNNHTSNIKHIYLHNAKQLRSDLSDV